jgi:hypothetical protein
MPGRRSDRPLRDHVAAIIFGHDTFAGKLFDVLLIVAILLSVLAVMLETVAEVRDSCGAVLRAAEWFFTLVFTAEYALRLWCSRTPMASTPRRRATWEGPSPAAGRRSRPSWRWWRPWCSCWGP